MANRETKSTKDRSKEKDSAPKRSPRPKPRPDDLMAGEAVKRGNRSKRRIESEAERMPQFAKGGEVRGCKSGQMSGKGFSGTY